MSTPSVRQQLEDLGLSAPTVKRNGLKVSPMKRTEFGAKKRAMVQWELLTYPTFEKTLRLHRLDFWHCVTAQTSQPGWPDFAVFGNGWHAFVELKARSGTTNRPGKLRTDQERWRDTIRDADGEWHEFLLPDQWHDVDVWLNGHTGKNIWGTWR